uniref:Uncharacterized protein n=1 Tax=Arundo donax TaxID=35708 RepID=A0A0A9AIG7_ARUDO
MTHVLPDQDDQNWTTTRIWRRLLVLVGRLAH